MSFTYGSQAPRRRYIAPMYSQLDVLTTLGSEQMSSRTRAIDPAFARAVFESYIQCKLRKGRTKYEISAKLQDLERGLPHLARSFQEARAATGLMPSPLFPPLQPAPAAAAPAPTPPGIRRSTTVATPPTSSSTPNRIVRAQTTTTRPVAQTVRAPAGPEDEPPPPPYSRQDPEPGATRVLQEQLSAVAEQSGAVVAEDPAAAREREQMEEAIRQSLAADAAQQSRRDSDEQPRSDRRVSSPQPGDGLAEIVPQHQRSQSDATRPTAATANDLHEQLGQLNIPGSFRESAVDSDQPPSGLAPPLSPIRTGSRNPFAAQVTTTSPATATPKSNNPFADPSSARAGSIHTVYAPPPGPPPNWDVQGTTAAGSSTSHAPPPRPTRSDSIRQSIMQNGGEDPLDMLKRYDTVILVDDSGSMAGGRWRTAKQALQDLAALAAEYDQDGIDIHFINDDRVGMGLTSADQVEQLFNSVKPGGSTPTGLRLEKILLEYMHNLEQSTALERRGELPRGEGVKPMNLIVITDGAPTDDPESVLATVAKRLDRGDFPLSQLGVQMLQIGNDPEAREALQELDDALSSKHGVRDMVDTVLYQQDEGMNAKVIIKALLGGINRRMDRRDV